MGSSSMLSWLEPHQAVCLHVVFDRVSHVHSTALCPTQHLRPPRSVDRPVQIQPALTLRPWRGGSRSSWWGPGIFSLPWSRRTRPGMVRVQVEGRWRTTRDERTPVTRQELNQGSEGEAGFPCTPNNTWITRQHKKLKDQAPSPAVCTRTEQGVCSQPPPSLP